MSEENLDMLERVAEAIEGRPWKFIASNRKYTLLVQARRVLSVMRQPTPKMLVDSGEMEGWGDPEAGQRDHCHVEWWQLMIDVAARKFD